MQRIFILSMCLVSTLMLGGCVSREQADAKMAKGCKAGAAIFLAEGTTVKEIVKSSFKTSSEFGKGFREVTLNVVESDGWYEPEAEYKCVFVESFGMFNMNHQADIHQLNVGGEIYGKKGEEIIGSLNDHMKLSDTVADAMGQ